MTGHTPLAALEPRPSRVEQICVACAEGDHEQVLDAEFCSCPCHGPVGLAANAEVAA